jgi:hypothetical protein
MVHESGFSRKVEEFAERTAYPQRNRVSVGEVPEPKYELQNRFRVDNSAFKGYGIDPKAKPSSVCPFALDCDARSSPPRVNSVIQANFAQHSNCTKPSERLGPAPLFRTKIEQVSSVRQRARQIEPCNVVVSGRPPSRVTVADLLTTGYGVEKHQEPRPSSRQQSAPAGRATVLATTPRTGGVTLFAKELTRDEMKDILARCGSLFESLNNDLVFDRVWIHASGGNNRAARLSVAKVSKSIEELGL